MTRRSHPGVAANGSMLVQFEHTAETLTYYAGQDGHIFTLALHNLARECSTAALTTHVVLAQVADLLWPPGHTTSLLAPSKSDT